MPPKLPPSHPSHPRPATPGRGISLHVRAATALIQARPAPPAGATRTPAPHVQAALGRTLQQSPNPGPRNPASHVQKAVAQARMPLGNAPAPRIEARRAGVLQRSKEDKSLVNIGKYSSLLDHYSEEEVQKVLEDGYEVRGHHSGKSGDGMNSATKQDLDQVGKALKENKKKEKSSKKQPKLHQQAPKSSYEKALAKADAIFNESGQGGGAEYIEYLNKKLEAELISDEQYDNLWDYFNNLK